MEEVIPATPASSGLDWKRREGASCGWMGSPHHGPASDPEASCRVKVSELQLTSSEVYFQPEQELLLQITNASLDLRFRRQLLYWFL